MKGEGKEMLGRMVVEVEEVEQGTGLTGDQQKRRHILSLNTTNDRPSQAADAGSSNTTSRS